MADENGNTRKSKYRVFTRQEFKKSDLWEKVQSYYPPFYLNTIITSSDENDLEYDSIDSIGTEGYMPWTQEYYNGVVAYDCRKCNGIVSGRPLLKEVDLDEFVLSCRKCRKPIEEFELYDD